jgi:hypothetical protein
VEGFGGAAGCVGVHLLGELEASASEFGVKAKLEIQDLESL